MSEEIKTMPVQGQTYNKKPGQLRELVVLRAYEVYCHLYGPQEAIVTGYCRGGFSRGELVAFLYARSFPQKEWRARSSEAFEAMNVD